MGGFTVTLMQTQDLKGKEITDNCMKSFVCFSTHATNEKGNVVMSSLGQTNISAAVYPVAPIVIATITVFGAVMAYSGQLMFRCAANRMEQKNFLIRLLKCFMAGTMLTKTALFAAMESKQS